MEFGVCYSEIVRLPYFNIIEQHVIEPIHHMGLGTEKHIVGIWKDIGLLGPAEFEIIQERVDSMLVPYGVGRIPLKICSRFSGLTADQWKNWTNIYSLYALRGVIPDEHYFCWSIFVEASLILIGLLYHVKGPFLKPLLMVMKRLAISITHAVLLAVLMLLCLIKFIKQGQSCCRSIFLTNI